MVDLENKELKDAVLRIIAEAPYKIVISNRRSKVGTASSLNEARLAENSSGSSNDDRVYEKIVISPITVKGAFAYQAEQFTHTQAFHLNMPSEDLPGYITGLLSDEFRQLDSFSDSSSGNIKISKKGKIMSGIHKKKATGSSLISSDIDIKDKRDTTKIKADQASENSSNPVKSIPLPTVSCETVPSHNRKKKRLIEEGTIVPPLIDMGIFTNDGKIVRSMGDKFRQINRFLEIVDDAVESCGFDSLTIVDFGCGKAYLTFILYYYLTYVRKIKATMIGLDLKADVIADCNAAAEKYGYSDLHFEVGDISSYTANGPIDMVITLHACDTATDYALYNAVKWGSRVILSVPCCQHELNAQIKSDEFSMLTKYGIIKERFAALATDALRASLLEHEGYKTQVLEFVDLSHTPKNLLIRAVKTNISAKKKQHSINEAESFMRSFNADPRLYKLLIGDDKDN